MANTGYSTATVTVATVLLLASHHIEDADAKPKLGVEKKSHLHFYVHNWLAGKNATGVEVASPPTTNSPFPHFVELASGPTTNSSFPHFGSLWVLDDLLTEGPEATSKMVGRAQGISISSSHEEFHLFMATKFVFESGKYKGSTLTMAGKNALLDKVREIPIVGGSGQFRLCRGYALARTYSVDRKSHYVVAEYNVTVLHY